MSCLKDLFTGMRARDVVFMSGYALYLTFGYMSFESPTVLTSLGESGAIVQSLFLVAVIAARMVVYAAMIALARRSGRGFSTCARALPRQGSSSRAWLFGSQSSCR